ncbi:TM2_domain-containing protein [Hexamita inflata]|uniref:TM2 domain-containing protein n=1 Tax=Hexamita inflata TaxID=28002 RepID=A0AA86QV03_9EUKA|nr:TM2 domain-containing protein [Hexamita inflata]CAI9958100.1 TM2 domain-containing protein [Hexamita inflata]
MLKRRSIWKTYAIWLFLGIFGGHYFYCYQYDSGIFYILTLGGFIFGWLGDIFIVPFLVFQTNQMIDNANNQQLRRIGEHTILEGYKYVMVQQVQATDTDGEPNEHML